MTEDMTGQISNVSYTKLTKIQLHYIKIMITLY